jgi:uncharacterized membrane protein YdjX (TVP38/TMEM64 family)
VRLRLRVRHVVWAVLIILIAGAPIISYFLFQDDWIPAFYKWIKAQGLIGALVFAIVYVIICVLLLAPAELMAVAAGFLYGSWGGALAVLSFFTAAVIAFLISRHFLRARVKAWTARRPLVAAIDVLWRRAAGSFPFCCASIRLFLPISRTISSARQILRSYPTA